MTIATLAHGARLSLARGLEALQDADAPPALLDVAQPVARAMGVLVEIETATGTPEADSAEPALEALREGLRLLQLPEHVEHPAAARGMAAVAETLGTVVELARSLRAQPIPPPPAAPPREDLARAPRFASLPVKPMHTLSPVRASPELQSIAVAPSPFDPAPLLAQPSRAPLAQPSRAPLAQPSRAPAPAKAPEPLAPAGPVIRKEVRRDSGLRRVDAPLGANSPSNFYIGLSGNDVVTAGGLFLATYQVPKLGETLILEISMPGGYEFVAQAVVAWTRSAGDAPSGPQSARGPAGPPGFGARFVEITEEGRRLIQRYVRNREPLFHDDL